MQSYYMVKNWGLFQHYKDRNPPWIKLHYELLSSETWVMLDDASRVLAVACMLIASRNEGKVPNNPDYLKRVAYLNKLPNLKPLLDCGFLEKTLADDSVCKQKQADARPETETYREETDERREEKKEVKKPPTSRGSRFSLDVLPEDWKEFCISERPDLTPHTVFESFKDHWKAAAGAKGVKLDWLATWRNWVRNTHTPKGNANGNRKQSTHTGLATKDYTSGWEGFNTVGSTPSDA